MSSHPILQTIRCTGCGASFPAGTEASDIACAYCEVVTKVDAARTAPQRDAPAAVDTALGEGTAALREALEYELYPSFAIALGLLFLPALFTFALTSPAIYTCTTYFPAFEAPVIALAVLAPAAVWLASFYVPIPWISLAFWGGRIDCQIDATLGQLHEDHKGALRPAVCPSCSGNIGVPIDTVGLTYGLCEATLLASEGLVVEWVADADARADAWKAQAEEAVTRLKAERNLPAVVAFATFYGVSAGMLIGVLVVAVSIGAALDLLVRALGIVE